MEDSRPVHLVLSLPAHLADEVERVSETDPEYLQRVLAYGMVRRAVFDHLRDVISPNGVTAPHFEAG